MTANTEANRLVSRTSGRIDDAMAIAQGIGDPTFRVKVMDELEWMRPIIASIGKPMDIGPDPTMRRLIESGMEGE